MTICLIGKNLTTLMLTKIFINEGLRVDLYDFNNKKHKKLSNTIKELFVIFFELTSNSFSFNNWGYSYSSGLSFESSVK